MAAFDRSHLNELLARTQYERWAVTYYRRTFFGQSEKPFGQTEIVVDAGDTVDTAHGNIGIFLQSALSEPAVKDALLRFVPLVFAAAFKIQDMVVEWTLAANGINEWQFSKKIIAYKRIASTGGFVLPPFLAADRDVERGCFALFERLSAYRNALTHGDNFALHADGKLEILDKSANVLVLELKDLGHYLRICDLLVDLVVGVHPLGSPEHRVMRYALAELLRLHGVPVAIVRKPRLSHLNLRFRGAALANGRPAVADVDLTAVHARMAFLNPVGVDGELVLALTVIAEVPEGDLVWDVKPEEVERGGMLTLREGDLARPPTLLPRD